MDHPITPPPELVEQWRATPEYTDLSEKLFLVTLTTKKLQDIATQAARWGADQQLKLDAEQIAQAYQAGADQELEACCEWVVNTRAYDMSPGALRAARRPKPPSLKEQALEVVTGLEKRWDLQCDLTLLRRALEALDD
jgi:alkylated DNA repair dioxygenase AlkB